ncbi:Protein phosphatase methylesterase 1 [Mycena sanguinolenta]|uniref:Protein phosphatase methylesterase 1 n=1 Tax=Mycena sanguinolenta TaxID=230812 RepID=A0A8H6ZDY8_9AGAR|nr:Protein phosphatase methylesterase 1 [Mycena sanguinolenta]
MSDLLRSTMAARLAKLPLDLPPQSVDEQDELDSEEAEAGDSLGALYSGLGPPAVPRQGGSKSRTVRVPNPDFAPISGADYFSEALQVAVPTRQLDCRVYYTPPKSEDGTVLVCHHGAGYAALSFACLAKELVGMSRGQVGVLSADARRHGKTKTTAEKEDENLDIGILVEDFVCTISAVWKEPAAAPTLLLVGHSMGGSVVTRAVPRLQEAGYRVSGVAVLDVVEGTAIDALPHMHSLLNARPDGFDSVEEAVEWHFKTKTIRNSHSARVSVPGIIMPSSSPLATASSSGGAAGQGSPHAYVWRTPLRSTAAYWPGWFTGLSAAFLQARTARLLLLAGTDRLDRELMIGQMQGKFQMAVVPGVGHVLHEDDPTHVAEILLEFWRRNDRLRMPAKVKGVGEA